MAKHIPIADMADFLHGRANRWRALALLEAYFDESGTEGSIAVVSYAGFCATKDNWSAVEQRWKRALRDFDIEWFHMVDLVHSRDQFAKFNAGWIGDVLNRFSMIVSESLDNDCLTPLWSGVQKPAWDKVEKSAKFLQQFPKPLDLCFDHIVHQMRRFSIHHAEAEPIAPMFADNLEYTKRNQEIYETYKQHPEWSKLLGPIAFGSPRQVVALQPADMFAYETTAHFDRLEGSYFDRVRGMRYMPVIHKIGKLIDVDLSGCIGTEPLKRIVRDFEEGRPIWGI